MTFKNFALWFTLAGSILTCFSLVAGEWLYAAAFGAGTMICFVAWLTASKAVTAPKKHPDHYHSCDGCGRRYICCCEKVDIGHVACPHCTGDWQFFVGGEPT